jgi:hypothetical protein
VAERILLSFAQTEGSTTAKARFLAEHAVISPPQCLMSPAAKRLKKNTSTSFQPSRLG